MIKFLFGVLVGFFCAYAVFIFLVGHGVIQMKEHKHAEVLRAIADGKTVQRRYPNDDWVDYVAKWHCSILDCSETVEWRVKPEPKPDVVKYLTVSKVMGLSHQDLSSNVVAIFCGDTGRLKSLELI